MLLIESVASITFNIARKVSISVSNFSNIKGPSFWLVALGLEVLTNVVHVV